MLSLSDLPLPVCCHTGAQAGKLCGLGVLFNDLCICCYHVAAGCSEGLLAAR